MMNDKDKEGRTDIQGDVDGPVFSGHFEGPVALGPGAEAVDARGSVGFVYKPTIETASVELPTTEQVRAHLQALVTHPEYARWSDDSYLDEKGALLPLYSSPYEGSGEWQSNDLLDTLRRYSPTIVLGEPGSGKTTTLERLAWEIASWSLSNGGTDVVPIVVRLFSYAGDVKTALRAAVNSLGILSIPNDVTLDAFLRTYSCWLMFDGLNEVPGNIRDGAVAEFSQFMDLYPDHQYVITSRSQDGLWETLRAARPHIAAIVVKDLEEKHVARYLGTELYERLDPGMRLLARRPLILWLLRSAAEQRGDLPTNRGELFSGFVRHILKAEAKLGKRGVSIAFRDKEKALAALAFQMHRERKLEYEYEAASSIIDGALGGRVEATRLLVEVKRNGLLKGDDSLHFLHETVQAYFVALRLRDILEANARAKGFADVTQRILLLGAGRALQLTKDLFSRSHQLFRNWMYRLYKQRAFAFVHFAYNILLVIVTGSIVTTVWIDLLTILCLYAIGYALLGIVKAVVWLLSRVFDSVSFNMLVWAEDEWWAESIIQLAGVHKRPDWLLRNLVLVNPWLAYWCTMATRNVSKHVRKSVELASVDVLKSRKVRIRVRGVRALAGLDHSRKARYLLALVRDSEPMVQQIALEALGQLWGVPEIGDLAQQRRYGTRVAAIQELATIGDPRAIGPLRALLMDQSPSLRIAIVGALEKLGWEPLNQEEQLIYWIAKEDWEACAKVRELAIRTLAGMLKVTEPDACILAITGLTHLEDACVIEPLIDCLDDLIAVTKVPSFISCGGWLWTWVPDTLSDFNRVGFWRIYAAIGYALEEIDETFAFASAPIPEFEFNYEILHRFASDLMEKVSDTPAIRARIVRSLVNEFGFWNCEEHRTIVDLLTGIDSEQVVQPIVRLIQSKIGSRPAIRTQLVTALVDRLRFIDIEERQALIILLVEIGGGLAVEPLIGLLGEPNSHAREVAAIALGRVGDTRAVEPLISLLDDESVEVYQAAAIALGELGDARAVPALKRWLEAPDVEVRAVARAAECLVGRSIDSEACSDIAGALASIDNEQVARSLTGLVRSEISDNPALKTQFVNLLVSELKLIDFDECQAIIDLLIEVGDEQVVGLLIDVLKEINPCARKAAAIALGRIGDDRAVEPLISLLNDEPVEVGQAAAIAMAEIGGVPATSALEEYLGNPNEVVPLAHKLQIVHEFARYSMGKSGCIDFEGYQAIVDLLVAIDDEPVTRSIVSSLRDKMSNNSLVRVQLVEALVDKLKCIDSEKREALVVLLVEVDGEQAVEPLTSLLEEPNSYVREAAAIALGRIGDTRATEPLISLLDDEYVEVYQAAAIALGELGDVRAIPALRRYSNDSDTEVRAVAAEALERVEGVDVKERPSVPVQQQLLWGGIGFLIADSGVLMLVSILWLITSGEFSIGLLIPAIVSAIVGINLWRGNTNLWRGLAIVWAVISFLYRGLFSNLWAFFEGVTISLVILGILWQSAFSVSLLFVLARGSEEDRSRIVFAVYIYAVYISFWFSLLVVLTRSLLLY
ncbi:MAG: HEAT repeat domain-containing protein [Chloroflexota bacterium]|nr:HEAT repeat domain-containing protein [Chloroflexota bacterium]